MKRQGRRFFLRIAHRGSHICTHYPLYAHTNNKMAAIVASNFAVAPPSKVAARKISSRKSAMPGTSS